MDIKAPIKNDRLWLLVSLVGVCLLYLNLIWQTTEDIDRLTTDGIFWGAIFWLLWQKKDRLTYQSDLLSSFIGWLLLSLTISKISSLFWFESNLLTLLPVISAIALSLIASGFKGLSQYKWELFFAWFLFFPDGVIGHLIDRTVQITVLNAKLASYLLYYFGFNVASQGNQVLLALPEGEYKAIVDYPCAGVPMILLMLKLALLLISLTSLPSKLKLLIPLFAAVLGFTLGVIRVCILTLLIPHLAQFNYWHGSQGDQIFSTIAIAIFAGICYWILETKEIKKYV